MKQIAINGKCNDYDHSCGISNENQISRGCDAALRSAPDQELPIQSVLNDERSSLSSFIPAVKQSAFVTRNLCAPAYSHRYLEVVKDALSMTKGELQKKYGAEYNSLRSRRQQAKSRHIKFFDSLKDIRDWLIHLGPRPDKGWTVDRIKSAKGYQPGNLRWATKIQQTHNRKVTRWHLLPDGCRLTTKQLSIRLGLPYLTVYKRFQAGWSIERLLGGEVSRDLESWKFPPELAEYAQPLYNLERRHSKISRLDWFISHFDNIFDKEYGHGISLKGNAIFGLMAYMKQAKSDRSAILQAQKEFEDEKLKELLLILDPPIMKSTSPEGSLLSPSSESADEFL